MTLVCLGRSFQVNMSHCSDAIAIATQTTTKMIWHWQQTRQQQQLHYCSGEIQYLIVLTQANSITGERKSLWNCDLKWPLFFLCKLVDLAHTHYAWVLEKDTCQESEQIIWIVVVARSLIICKWLKLKLRWNMKGMICVIFEFIWIICIVTWAHFKSLRNSLRIIKITKLSGIINEAQNHVFAKNTIIIVFLNGQMCPTLPRALNYYQKRLN